MAERMLIRNDFAFSVERDSMWSESCNCFGYAMGLKNWIYIKNWRKISNKKLAKIFQKTFDLIPVRKEDMVLGKEYVALRFDAKDDYHFIWRGKKGHWRHKMASWAVETISQKKVFSKGWCAERRFNGGYNSKIFLYEYDRSKMKEYFVE